MKLVLSLVIVFLSLSSFAVTLNCEGFKDGDLKGKTLLDAKRSYPHVYLQYDDVTMEALSGDGDQIILVLTNSKNRSEQSRSSISNYAKNSGFTYSLELSSSAGTYRLICK